MKKILALVLTAMLCLPFSACGKKNKDVIPAEAALPAIPEVAGEWGSIFYSEESLLTIREDGTCTLLRQPGTWGVHKDFSLWPNVLIVAQLDNGKEEQIEFYMYQGDDLGYSEGTITVRNSEISPVGVVDRTEVLRPEEAAAFVMGTWTEDSSSEPFATFNGDGTCDILGGKGVWGLNHAPYYNEDYAYGWDHYLFAQIGEQTWKVHVKEGQPGAATFSISNGPMEIVSTSQARNIGGDSQTQVQSQSGTVELTMDNWQNYFELVETSCFQKNAFGEVEGLTVGVTLRLKEEYRQRLVSLDNGAVECQYQAAVVGCQADMAAETYTLLDIHHIDERIYSWTRTLSPDCVIFSGTYIEEGSTNKVQIDMKREIYGASGPYNQSVFGYPVNIQITRIQGTLNLS